VLRVLGAHALMTRMLKDNLHLLDKVYAENKQAIPRLAGVFQKCVEFLTNFVARNNYENKAAVL
jgi:hypothetical protein